METEIEKALQQLANATGLTGETNLKRLFKILAETFGSFDRIVIERENRDKACYDWFALLSEEIAKAVKTPEIA
jgi:hypothetical protein